MPKIKKSSPLLIDLLTSSICGYNCEPKRMFGCLTYFVNSNMFIGAFEETIFLRLSPADKELIMKEFDEVGPFEPMPGRPMKEYVVLPESFCSDRELFCKWIDKSYSFASNVPNKKATQKKNLQKNNNQYQHAKKT